MSFGNMCTDILEDISLNGQTKEDQQKEMFRIS